MERTVVSSEEIEDAIEALPKRIQKMSNRDFRKVALALIDEHPAFTEQFSREALAHMQEYIELGGADLVEVDITYASQAVVEAEGYSTNMRHGGQSRRVIDMLRKELQRSRDEVKRRIYDLQGSRLDS